MRWLTSKMEKWKENSDGREKETGEWDWKDRKVMEEWAAQEEGGHKVWISLLHESPNCLA